MALRKDIRVMVVDDMAVSRQILVQMLEQIGVNSTITAQSASDALTTLEKFPADIIISDLNMPEMNGLDLLKHLRNDRRSFGIGFVMTSGDESDEKVVDAWHHGMDRFLPKPFEIQGLMTCLEGVAGRM